jgi:chromosome partitioning protein
VIISLANYKSSVGKTTTAINLAAALIERGHSVHLWDLDAQRDLSHVARTVGFEVSAPIAAVLGASLKSRSADFHLIECPPRREMESQVLAALAVSDALIIPNECEYLMLRGWGNFEETLQKALKAKPSLAHRALVTKYKPRQKKHLASFMAQGKPHFQTIIRDSIWVADAPAYDKTVLQYAPRSGAARAFRALAKEVEQWKSEI